MAAKRRVEDTEVRKIQDVPKGEYVRLKYRYDMNQSADGFTKKVYKNDGWDSLSRTYYVDDTDDISRGRYVKKDTLVLVGFTY